MQGGFLIVRPDLVVFENMKMIVKKGDFRPGSGWGGTGAGSFWGGQTIQVEVYLFIYETKLHI